jgi:hypothetical protein
VSEGVTPELLALVDKLRFDLTAAQGKLSEIKRALAAMPQAPTKAKMPCPHCGLEMGSLRRLSEHLENMGEDHGFVGVAGEPRVEEPSIFYEELRKQQERRNRGEPDPPSPKIPLHTPRGVKQLDDILPPPSVSPENSKPAST